MAAFKLGDLVWAKMKGFSFWPGKVVSPDLLKRPALKKPMQCILFFGTKNIAWITEDRMKPYNEFKEEFTNQNKSSVFRAACDEIEEFICNFHCESVSGSDLSIVEQELSPNFASETNKERRDDDRLIHSNYNVTPKRSRDESERTFTKNARGEKSEREPSLLDLCTSNRQPKDMKEFSKYNIKTSSIETDNTPQMKRIYKQPVKLSTEIKPLKQKTIKRSCFKFGVLGLGNIGQWIVKNLLKSGHEVTVWNRTPEKCKQLLQSGAAKGHTPADVVSNSDITFSCVSDPLAAKELVFGSTGILQEMKKGKDYVEITTIDQETSQDIAKALKRRGARYLEAQIQSSKDRSEDVSLILLTAGDQSLYEDCQFCFQAIAANSFFLGAVGNACKMQLSMQLIHGTVLAGLAEGLALAERSGLQQKDLMEILQLSTLACPDIIDNGKSMIEGIYPSAIPLQRLQNDLKLTLQLGDQLEQPLPLAATANEIARIHQGLLRSSQLYHPQFN